MVIDKPQGFTSHACVSRLRRCYGLKRVGHGGTLDPAVTGVLPIALGQATRLLPYLPGEKTYTGLIQLGTTTDSDDLQGEVIKRQSHPQLRWSAIDAALDKFRGQIEQRPPQVSAVHVNGERAYARARRGEIMDIPARTVTIHQLQLMHWDEQRSAAVERALFSWDLHPRDRAGHRRTSGVWGLSRITTPHTSSWLSYRPSPANT